MDEFEGVAYGGVAPSLGYAIRDDASWRAVDVGMVLDEDEMFYKQVPDWARQMDQERADRIIRVAAEDAWRELEISTIANQLMAIEEAESAIEEGVDPPADLLPGTRSQWLAYRTKVRAWKEGGNNSFPDEAFRPTRPK